MVEPLRHLPDALLVLAGAVENLLEYQVSEGLVEPYLCRCYGWSKRDYKDVLAFVRRFSGSRLDEALRKAAESKAAGKTAPDSGPGA